MQIRYEMRDGFGVVVKTATTPHDVSRLEKEHSVLSRLNIEGVTRIHSVHLTHGANLWLQANSQRRARPPYQTHPQHQAHPPYQAHPQHQAHPPYQARPQAPELALYYIGRHNLGTFSSPRDWQWLFLLLRCFQLLERLHQQGVAHGAITQSHILLNHQNQPTLCSFGRAVELDEAGVLAQGDVSSLLRCARQVLAAVPADDPVWAKRMRGDRPRLLHQLKSLVSNLAETRQAAASRVVQQLSQLASAAGYSLTHDQDTYLREMHPAEPVLPNTWENSHKSRT